MRTTLTLLLAIYLYGVAIAAGVEVQDSTITISGHYRSNDGRVRDHKFPVEIQLLANGKFAGVIESWIEERLSDGTSNLDYFKTSFSGSWMIKSQTIFINVEEGSIFPGIIFPKMNGLNIVITNKKS